MLEQLARVPRVFTRYERDVSQHLQRTVSDVSEVSDRCRNEIKSARHV